MSLCTSEKIKAALVAFSGMMMLALVLFSPAPASSSAVGFETGARHDHAYSPHHILFKRGTFDTNERRDLDTAAADLRLPHDFAAESERGQMRTRIIQLAGPVKSGWVEQIRATGAEIVAYIPNNAYIIRGTSRAIARLASMDAGSLAGDESPIRWMGEFRPVQKIDPAFGEDLLAASDSPAEVDIELLDSPESDQTIERIRQLAEGESRAPRRFLNYVVLSFKLAVNRLMEVAALDDVLFIAPSTRARMHDERSTQIVAANFAEGGTRPSGPGYLAWLESKGLARPSDFVIDFTDTGLDRGSSLSTLLHPDFRDAEGLSRVAYNTNYTRDADSHDRLGHGTIVAATAVGLGDSNRKDAEGYVYGTGVDPMARLGASRIFDHSGKLPFQLSFTGVAAAAYAAGARMSNNSWGYPSNSYDAAAQEYDALVRDAQPAVPGNQEMLFVFSAGNGGAGGHVSSPGLAKNVISVAASESYRPEGTDSCNFDGQGAIGPEGADNALDILRFSSGGPTTEGRAKPDIAAPGTHIFGAASQAPRFFAEGLCPGTPFYNPPDQDHLYTWSSGTSLAAPHVTGAASLIRKAYTLKLLPGGELPPSPAMIKALLTNSASYMTGENAGGDLPSARQGWGRVNLGRALDDAQRILIDQKKLLTESGQVFEVEGSIADRSRGVHVTLAWTDAPGALAGAAIVNDLDLEITIGDTTVFYEYRGNNFANEWSAVGGEADRVNNVESIYVPPDVFPQGAQGNFRVIVRAANIAGDGVPGNESLLDQDFALVVYNVKAPVPRPPVIEFPVITHVSYENKRLTIVGQLFNSAARVEINGELIERDFEFNEANNSLSIKLKHKKLNLKKEADNLIVVVVRETRSAPFRLRL